MKALKKEKFEIASTSRQAIKEKVKDINEEKKLKKRRLKTSFLVNRIINFCEVLAGKKMWPYQREFSFRIIECILERNIQDTPTGLFSRQSGKSECVAMVASGCAVILPILANMSEFSEDERFNYTFKSPDGEEKYFGYKFGFKISVYAPAQPQSDIVYTKVRNILSSQRADEILTNRDINIQFMTNNGNTVALSNGSLIRSFSASETSHIEGYDFHLCITDESQEISTYKLEKCLAKGSKVWTPQGKINIENVVKNKLSVIDMYGKVKKPDKFYNNGVQSVFEITLSNGRKIEATENHQFFIRTRINEGRQCKSRPVWKMVKDLKLNDGLACPRKIELFGKEKGTYEEGLFLGAMLGDGCVVSNTPIFCCDYKSRLYRKIKNFANSKNCYTTLRNYSSKNNLALLAFPSNNLGKNRNQLTAFLKDYKLWQVCGDKKNITKKMRKQGKEFLRGLVVGLIETDGCVGTGLNSNKSITFSNISESMVRNLQDVLVYFGIKSRISFIDNRGKSCLIDGRKRPLITKKILWNLTIRDCESIRIFFNEFKLLDKQENLKLLYKFHRKRKSRFKVTNFSNHGVKQKGWECDNVYFDRIIGIKYIGKKETYCLEVKDRNFIVNGVVSSNSILPMGSALGGIMVMIGTCFNTTGYYYNTIEQNKKYFAESGIKNHFEYNYLEVQKYNPLYKLYIDKEKRKKGGENSDAFKMNFVLQWILERGQYVTEDMLKRIRQEDKDLVFSKTSGFQFAGIDFGKSNDSTVITVLDKVDGTEDALGNFDKLILSWLELYGDNYESQFEQIVEFLTNFHGLRKIAVDSTGVGDPIADRLKGYFEPRIDVLPVVMTPQSISDMFKDLQIEIQAKRLLYPASAITKESLNYIQFEEQMLDCVKEYNRGFLRVSHQDDKSAHDDYVYSLGLSCFAAINKEEDEEMGTVEEYRGSLTMLNKKFSLCPRGRRKW